MIQHGRLILASQSEARAAMLRTAALTFEARPARIDEDALKQAAQAESWPAADTALELARLKATRIRDPEALIIGADQILVCEDRWFNKPNSLAEARTHLLALRGRTHELVTAVVCIRAGIELWRHVAVPRLLMRPFSDGFLDAYLAIEAEAVLNSVGAYRLEGPGIHLFDQIEGEFAAILGLPMLPLLGFLRQNGVLQP